MYVCVCVCVRVCARTFRTIVHVTFFFSFLFFKNVYCNFVLSITFLNQYTPNFSYTDSMYIQIDFCMIKHTLFILTYSGSFVCENQFYYY